MAYFANVCIFDVDGEIVADMPSGSPSGKLHGTKLNVDEASGFAVENG